MKHPTKLCVSTSPTPHQLATALAGLRYDKLSEYLKALAMQLADDGNADGRRNRHELATRLYEASVNLWGATSSMREAWSICKPFELKKPDKCKIVPERQDKVKKYSKEIAELLKLIGHPEAWVSDKSMIADFRPITYDYKTKASTPAKKSFWRMLKKISKAFGFEVKASDYLVDIAERMFNLRVESRF